MVLSLFHRRTRNGPFCQRYYVYFTELFAAIHHIKRTVLSSRKFEDYCAYLNKVIAALLLKGPCLFQRALVTTIFLKDIVLNARKQLQ